MRRFYVFHYVPEILLPLFVLAVGRRPCCGARWLTPPLAGCARGPTLAEAPSTAG